MDLKSLRDMPPWDRPRNAGTTLLGVLRNRKAAASDRLLAAELAGDVTVIDDEIALALLDVVRSSDEPAELRGQAAIALGPSLEQAELDGFDVEADPTVAEATVAEATVDTIQKSLRAVYRDPGAPKEVRRRALEASVRASQDWHADAVRAGYRSDDAEWRLTSVFCMSYVPGFDAEIVDALGSKDEEILCAAVRAAGDRCVQAAWPQVATLVQRDEIDKPLLLAVIDAVASIRPREAPELLGDLVDSKDEDVAGAVEEALALAGEPFDGDEFGDEDPFDEEETFELDDGTEVSRTKNVVRLKTKLDFGPKGVPLDQLGKIREKAAAEHARILPKVSRKVGRNDPCPCGSGKKYKKCCGR